MSGSGLIRDIIVSSFMKFSINTGVDSLLSNKEKLGIYSAATFRPLTGKKPLTLKRPKKMKRLILTD
jgi:hypothetical protein